MDTWDLVATVLFLMAGIGMVAMLSPPPRRAYQPTGDIEIPEVAPDLVSGICMPDPRATRSWIRAERHAKAHWEGEPRILTPDRLDAWRKEQKAKVPA